MASAGAIKAGKAIVELATDDGPMAKGLRRAQAKLHDFARSAAIVGGALTGVGAAAAGAFVPAIKAASEAAEVTSRFNQVYGSLAGEAGQFADDLASSVNRSSTEIRKGMASYQAFFVGLGFGTDQAADLSKQLQKTAIDFASFNNISDSEAQGRMLSALSGSSEVLDQFGVNIKQAAIEQELLNKGFAGGVQAATEQQKALARLSIITRAMSDQGALGDAVRTSGNFANQLKGVQAAAHEAQIALGNRLLPAVTPLLEIAGKLLRIVERWAKENGELVTSIFRLSAAATALGAAMLGVSAATYGASTAIKVLSANLIGLQLATILGGITVGVIGLTAAFNDGMVAGFNFGEMVRRLGVDLNILSDEFDKMQARAKDLESIGKEINTTKDRLSAAQNDRERAKALERLIELQKQYLQSWRQDVDALARQQKPFERFRDEFVDARVGSSPSGSFARARQAHADAPRAYEDYIKRTVEADGVTQKLRTELASLEKQIQKIRPQAAVEQVIENVFSKAVPIAKNAHGRVQALLSTVEDYVGRMREFGRLLNSINAFAATDPVESAKISIRQQADALLDQLAQSGQFTSGMANRIREIAANRIDKVQRDAADAAAEAAAEFNRQLIGFTGSAIEAEAAAISGQRDALIRQAESLGVATPDLREQLNTAADEKIAELRLSKERELQNEIARLEIQATKKGLAQRLALIELERKEAIRNAEAMGESAEYIAKLGEMFDLQARVAGQGAAVSGKQTADLVFAGSAQAQALRFGDRNRNKDDVRYAKETARNTRELAKKDPVQINVISDGV